MILATRVRVLSQEDPPQPIPGVRVCLYDRDEHSMDDFLASGTTDAKGEVSLVFDSARYTDEEDQPEWRIESLPDLYVVVYNDRGEVALTTRAQAFIDQLPPVITVTAPRAAIYGA
jgi:hypothetical protein